MPSSFPIKVIDDLATLFPEVASQADGWDPSTVLFFLAVTKNKVGNAL